MVNLNLEDQKLSSLSRDYFTYSLQPNNIIAIELHDVIFPMLNYLTFQLVKIRNDGLIFLHHSNGTILFPNLCTKLFLTIFINIINHINYCNKAFEL